MKHAALLSLILFTQISLALVDTKSANYSESTPYMIVPGIGYDLRLTVTYNSRSLYSGLFGFGQCSDYETKTEVTPEGNIKVIECGGGQEVLFTSKNFNPNKVDTTIKQIVTEVKRRRPELNGTYLANLEKDLKTDDFMREEFSRRMNIKGKTEDGATYYVNGKEAENIALKGNVLKRTLADGTYQLFDPATGHMLQMYDKNQNYLKLTWDKDLLQQVADNQGRKLNFRYNQATHKVTDVVGPANMTAKFTVRGEDLVEAIDYKKEKFKYTYDDVHNLTRIDFNDGTYKALTYNKDRDWVTSFRNRKGCVETYDYQFAKDDGKNHFWSDVVKKCGEKVTNNSHYEFWHRARPDNTGVYLYRVRTEVNGAITDILYHDVFNKPISMLKDNVRTEYTYWDNGFVKTKKEPGRRTKFEYNNTCQKVSLVMVDVLEEEPPVRKTASAKAEKILKQIKTKFSYEARKCNLVTADNSDGQIVRLQYDEHGRISQIEDQSKKLVKIEYEKKFGKPFVVTRPGLGAIKVSYKADGEIAKVDSKEGPVVARQVASIFNNLLEIIAPANNDTTL